MVHENARAERNSPEGEEEEHMDDDPPDDDNGDDNVDIALNGIPMNGQAI